MTQLMFAATLAASLALAACDNRNEEAAADSSETVATDPVLTDPLSDVGTTSGTTTDVSGAGPATGIDASGGMSGGEGTTTGTAANTDVGTGSATGSGSTTNGSTLPADGSTSPATGTTTPADDGTDTTTP